MRKFLFKFSVLLLFLSVLAAFASAQECYDRTGDGKVNIFDLVFVATRLGTTGGTADVDNSGTVGIEDIVMVAGDFGECEVPKGNCVIGSAITDECICDGVAYSKNYCCADGYSATSCGMQNECNDGSDNDGDGLIDFEDDGGTEGAALGCFGPNGQETETDYGWTLFTPTTGTDHDTQIIFVSSSDPDADDTNCVGYTADDLTALGSLEDIIPCETIAQGLSLLNNGDPDWLLLKRGDEFYRGFTKWEWSGYSASEPLIFASYGDSQERPLFKSDLVNFNHQDPENTIRYVSFIGIKFLPTLYDGKTWSATAIRFTKPSENILIEDNYFSEFKTNVRMTYSKDLTIRRNVIVDSYADSSVEVPLHAQGIFSAYVENYLIEENVIVHNGWKGGVENMYDTKFNHNIYLSGPDNINVVVKDNIFAQASSHGIQARSGAEIVNNSFIQNPYSILFGGVKPGGVEGSIEDNVFIESKKIHDTTAGGTPIDIQNTKPEVGVSIRRNIFAHSTLGAKGNVFNLAITKEEDDFPPIEARTGINNVLLENNIIYDWGAMYTYPGFVQGSTGRTAFNNFVMRNNNFQVLDYWVIYYTMPYQPSTGDWENNNYYSDTRSPDIFFKINRTTKTWEEWIDEETGYEPTATNIEINYLDPDRTVGSYHATLDRVATTEAFLQEARQQSKFNWRPEYTAAEFNEYIKDGFAVVGG